MSTPPLGATFILFNGPLFMGTLFNWGLFGALSVQVFSYLMAGYNDRKWLRWLVCTVYLLDILQTVFATQCVWDMVIFNWGNPAIFVAPPWTAYSFPIMSGLLGAIVQIFFAWRIWIINETRLAKFGSVFIVLVALMQFTSAFVVSIRSAFIDILDVGELYPGFVVWLAGAFACDVIIVIGMLAILRSARGNSHFERTNSIIDRLIVRTVHSGTITAIAALVELCLYLTMPNNFLHDCPALFSGKLYSNVLLANLNGRRRDDTSYTIGSYQSSRLPTLSGASTELKARMPQLKMERSQDLAQSFTQSDGHAIKAQPIGMYEP